jgi:hypothetical protein
MRGLTFFLLVIAISSLYSQPITLRDTTNKYDYIIITVPELINACEPFKQHKETVRGFETLIVDTTQIFAEFDSSATPQDNIRDFISYAGTFWMKPRPKYFLIAGRVIDVPNFLIQDPWTSIYYPSSDFYYSQNKYENDPTTTDFYIGRIPCRDEIELSNYFLKIIEYESDNTLLPWMNNNLFICDNNIQLGFFEFAMVISKDYLPDFIRSYFIVDDSNSVYYGNKDSIYKAINERGNSIIWFGPNSDTFVIRPDYFNISDLSGLENADMPFLTIFVLGQSSIIDTNTNMTREMLVMNNAGSMAGIVFVGSVYWGVSRAFQVMWAQNLFNTEIQSIGEAFILDALPSSGIFGYMKKITNLWADPSLRLKYDITVDAKNDQNEFPNRLVLHQNYPNPFNPSTTIKYSIPELSFVTIKVYDVLGSEVVTLVSEEKPAGSYEIEFDATALPSGVYFYQLKADSFVETKKMVLMK